MCPMLIKLNAKNINFYDVECFKKLWDKLKVSVENLDTDETTPRNWLK